MMLSQERIQAWWICLYGNVIDAALFYPMIMSKVLNKRTMQDTERLYRIDG